MRALSQCFYWVCRKIVSSNAVTQTNTQTRAGIRHGSVVCVSSRTALRLVRVSLTRGYRLATLRSEDRAAPHVCVRHGNTVGSGNRDSPRGGTSRFAAHAVDLFVYVLRGGVVSREKQVCQRNFELSIFVLKRCHGSCMYFVLSGCFMLCKTDFLRRFYFHVEVHCIFTGKL